MMACTAGEKGTGAAGLKQLVWLSTARGVAWSLQNSEQEVCDNFLLASFQVCLTVLPRGSTTHTRSVTWLHIS
jgi:hypothetical protein